MAGLNRRQVGAAYEERAVYYLKSKGYRIVARNYRNRYGEVDIIAEDSQGVMVYFEVKYRSSSRYGEPLEAVGTRKQKKICNAALWHYARSGYAGAKPVRFDVIGVFGEQTIQHIEAAFEYQGDE